MAHSPGARQRAGPVVGSAAVPRHSIFESSLPSRNRPIPAISPARTLPPAHLWLVLRPGIALRRAGYLASLQARVRNGAAAQNPMLSSMGPPAPRPSPPQQRRTGAVDSGSYGPGPSGGEAQQVAAPRGSSPAGVPEPDVLDQPCVFQCRACKSIVGDTTSLVVAIEEAGVLALSTATGVECGEELRLSRAGPDSGCTFNALSCATCKARVGCVYRTTVAALDLARGLFSLQRRSLTSYQLGSGVVAGADEATAAGVATMPQLVDAVADQACRLEDVEAAVRALGAEVARLEEAAEQAGRVAEQAVQDAAAARAAADAAAGATGGGGAGRTPRQGSASGATSASRTRQKRAREPASGATAPAQGATTTPTSKTNGSAAKRGSASRGGGGKAADVSSSPAKRAAGTLSSLGGSPASLAVQSAAAARRASAGSSGKAPRRASLVSLSAAGSGAAVGGALSPRHASGSPSLLSIGAGSQDRRRSSS